VLTAQAGVVHLDVCAGIATDGGARLGQKVALDSDVDRRGPLNLKLLGVAGNFNLADGESAVLGERDGKRGAELEALLLGVTLG
jgi:hypothetical protein